MIDSPAALAAFVRRSRLLAVAFSVVGVACALAGVLGPTSLAALLLVPLVLAIVHQVMFRRLGWRALRAPTSFLPGFAAAPPQTPYGAGLVVGSALVAIRLASMEADLTAVGSLVLFGVVTVLVAYRLFARPYLALRPDGLVIGKRTLPWAAVWPEGPPAPDRFARTLRVLVVPGTPGAETTGVSAQTWARMRERGLSEEVDDLLASDPSLVREGPPSVPIDLRWVAVDRPFLAEAIHRYRNDPAQLAG
ncbi:hypothetical protein [Cryptosporangium phraense]|uniref:Uncharacterized protein n=1 Tax=Cryptosporangium phraense TaxID=2593070 RepID=A0A545AE97_9ACTN|nr:hypothetical protein [Cryptosporangium phraense]TQS39629.1 hypothetical protein FL583_39030 [Cryptosporangium phraense]